MTEKAATGVRYIKDWAVTIATALTIVTVFKSFAYASYFIPSESMMPTLEVGDRLFVNKAAYGYSKYSFPFSEYLPSLPGKFGRILYKQPSRGDVIVFSNPVNNVVTIKRLVGLPGDEIRIDRGRLYINGTAVRRNYSDSYTYREYEGRIVSVREYTEPLPGGTQHKILERSDHEFLDNTGTYRIPERHVFLLGDNRDNSTDSRVLNRLGYVPIENIIGRADILSFSFYQCDKTEGLRCGKKRFLEPIQ